MSPIKCWQQVFPLFSTDKFQIEIERNCENIYNFSETVIPPDKKLAILTCMDIRLIELLPAALGIKNGDAKIIKNAGGTMVHPYGSVVRSLLVGILELGVEEVMVIGHTDCGVQGMDGKEMLELLEKRGIDKQHIDIVRHSGINLENWLGGFESVESSVHETVKGLKEHPLMPKNVKISGFIMNSETGLLTKVEE